MTSRPFFLVEAALVCLICSAIADAHATIIYTKWMSGTGDFADAAHWSQGVPDANKWAEIHGDSIVRISSGTYAIDNLQIGKNSTDHARVDVDGGKIIL